MLARPYPTVTYHESQTALNARVEEEQKREEERKRDELYRERLRQIEEDQKFIQLFNLPATESKIEDFSCALEVKTGLLAQGRMYISNNFICFYSAFFPKSRKILPFSEVTSIKKRNTAVVFPTAIEIEIREKKYFFGSFLYRDQAFDLCMKQWEEIQSSLELTDTDPNSVRRRERRRDKEREKERESVRTQKIYGSTNLGNLLQEDYTGKDKTQDQNGSDNENQEEEDDEDNEGEDSDEEDEGDEENEEDEEEGQEKTEKNNKQSDSEKEEEEDEEHEEQFEIQYSSDSENETQKNHKPHHLQFSSVQKNQTSGLKQEIQHQNEIMKEINHQKNINNPQNNTNTDINRAVSEDPNKKSKSANNNNSSTNTIANTINTINSISTPTSGLGKKDKGIPEGAQTITEEDKDQESDQSDSEQKTATETGADVESGSDNQRKRKNPQGGNKGQKKTRGGTSKKIPETHSTDDIVIQQQQVLADQESEITSIFGKNYVGTCSHLDNEPVSFGFLEMYTKKLPISVQKFFIHFLTEKFQFWQNFHSTLPKYSEFQASDWSIGECCASRQFTFLLGLNYSIGPKQTRVVQTHWSKYENGVGKFSTRSQSLDIPYSDCFFVYTYWLIRPDPEDQNSCFISIYVKVDFAKSVMMKGMIDKSSKEGTKEYYALWFDYVNLCIQNIPKDQPHHHRIKGETSKKGKKTKPKSTKSTKSTQQQVTAPKPLFPITPATPVLTQTPPSQATPSLFDGGMNTIILGVFVLCIVFLFVSVWKMRSEISSLESSLQLQYEIERQNEEKLREMSDWIQVLAKSIKGDSEGMEWLNQSVQLEKRFEFTKETIQRLLESLNSSSSSNSIP